MPTLSCVTKIEIKFEAEYFFKTKDEHKKLTQDNFSLIVRI